MQLFREFRRRSALRRKRREWEHKRDWIWDAFEKDIKAAKTLDEQQSLESGRQHECSEYEDKLRAMESTEISRRAQRCHLAVSDFPLPPGETSHWTMGIWGDWYIHPKALREFSKAVEEAEHERAKRNLERRDFWLKIFTAIFAAAAAVASIINLFMSHKP